MSVRHAVAIYFTDGDFIAVGEPYRPRELDPRKGAPEVTQIRITDDLPALTGTFMERARVFVGPKCVFEAPVHALEGVRYAMEDEV